MKQSTQQKVLAVIASCYTPAHIEAADRMLANVKAPAEIIKALQVRRVEIAASVAVQVADKLADAEDRLFQAEWCLTVAAKAKNVHSIQAWTANVIKARKEVSYWERYFETTEI